MDKYTIAWFSNETGEAGNEYKSAGYWGDKSTVIAIVNERNGDPRNIGESGRLRTIYSTVPVLEAALGMSDEPQPAVAVETPAAPDSELSPKAQQVLAHWQAQYTETSRGLKTWRLANGEWINESDIDELVAAGLVNRINRRSLIGPLEALNEKGLAYVVIPTSAAVAITDDSAVDNTPSDEKREIAQPSGAEVETTWQSVSDVLFPAGYEWQGGLITGRIVNTGTGIIEGTVKSGWLSDALQDTPATWTDTLITPDAVRLMATINVTSEAAAYDDYLPSTVEDNDDLPFSDLGEDDTPNWTSIDGDIIDSQRERIYELEAQNWQRNETIASLEARVKELEGLLSQVVNYNDVPEITDGNLIRKIVAALYEAQ